MIVKLNATFTGREHGFVTSLRSGQVRGPAAPPPHLARGKKKKKSAHHRELNSGL